MRLSRNTKRSDGWGVVVVYPCASAVVTRQGKGWAG